MLSCGCSNLIGPELILECCGVSRSCGILGSMTCQVNSDRKRLSKPISSSMKSDKRKHRFALVILACEFQLCFKNTSTVKTWVLNVYQMVKKKLKKVKSNVKREELKMLLKRMVSTLNILH